MTSFFFQKGRDSSKMSNPYPSALLNEIHAYFPALLYDSERFNTIQHVMGYVNTQMRRNFDIFSTNREAYLSREYATPVRQTRQRASSPPPQRRQRQRTQDIPVTQPPIPTDDMIDDDMLADDGPLAPMLTNWLTNILMQPPGLGRQYTYPLNITTWLEPISVRPSPEVLSTNTTISVLENTMESPCVICQDSIEQGATVRKIISCGHIFHQICIDTWFQTHVQCPTCRHDVRQMPASSNTNGT